ncbi:Pecanex-like protein 4 [Chionoecetes opilio]|uniref:Pecanex-like protein 4 n=1 Tax=Chionoecetes opilio TaxID=41210 RepID=A0A8J4XMG7_CHIOP|nr:Pecanex-like protein 4 [Chionoecetes opilio]
MVMMGAHAKLCVASVLILVALALEPVNAFSTTTARLAWAGGHGGMESPLLSAYKRPFIKRRLLETFLGGLRLGGAQDAPPYVPCFQVLLWCVVPVVTVVFVLLEQAGVVGVVPAVVLSGMLDALYALVLQLTAAHLRRRHNKEADLSQVQVGREEEVVVFDSPLGPNTWGFLVRAKKAKAGLILCSLMAGVVGAPACTTSGHPPPTT